jgi:hypothetical protein
MPEVKHNGYYGVAALIGLAGISLLFKPSDHGFWGVEHGVAVALLVLAGLLFMLTATENLPGLSGRRSPRLLTDEEFGYEASFSHNGLHVDITNKHAESGFEARMLRFLSSYQYGMPHDWYVGWRNEGTARVLIGAGLTKHLDLADLDFTAFLKSHVSGRTRKIDQRLTAEHPR